jgi:hypothetical protein
MKKIIEKIDFLWKGDRDMLISSTFVFSYVDGYYFSCSCTSHFLINVKKTYI